MNHTHSMLIVATYTDQGNGRLIAWDIDKNTTRIVDKQAYRVTSMTWTEDDSWLIIGRDNGEVEFWSVYNENNKKLQNIYKNLIPDFINKQQESMSQLPSLSPMVSKGSYVSDKEVNKGKKPQDNNNEDNTKANAANDEENEDKKADNDKRSLIPIFDKQFVEHVHTGPVFNITCSNGVLISSANPKNSNNESCDHILYDIRCLMNAGVTPRIISRLHNLNGNEKDITRLLSLSPATPRHVREGGGPGTLIAATGYHHVYCHNMLDVLLDSLLMGALQ